MTLGRPRFRWEDIRILFEYVGKERGLDLSGKRQGQMAGSCGHCNKASGSIECGEFID